MEVKANVQKRRHDRLKELEARNRIPPAAGPAGRDRRGEGLPPGGRTDGPEPAGGPDELPLWIRGPMEEESAEADHGGDPEKAWKIREKELLRWYEEGDRYRGASGRSGDSGRSYPGSPGGPGSPGYGGPTPPAYVTGPAGGRGFGRTMAVQTLAAVLVFAAVVGVSRIDTPWAAEAKRQIRTVLTEDMNFEQAAAWYGRTFEGAPSLLPAFGVKTGATKVHAPVPASRFIQPVKGQAKEEFKASGQGIWIDTKPDAHVAAMDDGRIEYAGDRTDTGYTLVIQHADGYLVTYGGLKPFKWEAGDWVKAGDVIGSAGANEKTEEGSGSVFLAVMKDQRYIDPLDVVTLD